MFDVIIRTGVFKHQLRRTVIEWIPVPERGSLLFNLQTNALLLHQRSTERLRLNTDPVKVVEGGAELVQLVLADSLGISRQDLVLDFVDGSGDGGEELLPAHTDVLQGRDMGRDMRRDMGVDKEGTKREKIKLYFILKETTETFD